MGIIVGWVIRGADGWGREPSPQGGEAMPLLFIHARDATFQACDEGAEYEQPQDALAIGVQGAMALLADEINQGQQNAAVEISVQEADGTQILRSVVAISVSPLLPRSASN